MERRANFRDLDLWPSSGSGGDVELAKGARIDVAQFAALDEGEDHVGVLGLGVLGTLGAQQLTAHAQVDDEVGPVVEAKTRFLPRRWAT
jgi:hypothetical protein